MIRILLTAAFATCVVAAHAETVGDASREGMLADPFFVAVLHGTKRIFDCANLWSDEIQQVRIYKSHNLPEERPDIEYLFQFKCQRGVSADIELSYRSGRDGRMKPGKFGNLREANFHYDRLERYIETRALFFGDHDLNKAVTTNPIVAATREAFNRAAPHGCTWAQVFSTQSLRIRDESKVESQPFIARLRCEREKDRSCIDNYEYRGLFYPSRAYVLLMKIEFGTICA